MTQKCRFVRSSYCAYLFTFFNKQQTFPVNNTNLQQMNRSNGVQSSSFVDPMDAKSVGRVIDTNEAFARQNHQISRQDRPQLPQNDIQSQVHKLKKPPPNIQRQTSLPTQQHEYTKVANDPGSTYRAMPNQSRRASDANFQKESRQAIVGEIERLILFKDYNIRVEL